MKGEKVNFFAFLIIFFLYFFLPQEMYADTLQVSGCVPGSTTCGSWSACSSGSQSRTCTDNCGNSSSESQSCTSGTVSASSGGGMPYCVPTLETCEESECIEHTMVRTCRDGCRNYAEVLLCGYQCSDTFDNDNDGFSDYPVDPGCLERSDDNESDPEISAECSDGLDNDLDGMLDFPDDPECESSSDIVESQEEYVPQCSDNLDNDGDGNIDYLNDVGCESNFDNSEENGRPAQCSDGIDNDSDGKIDFPNDSGCVHSFDNDERNSILRQCSDGLDNDTDGKVDYPNDPECSDVYDNTEEIRADFPECMDSRDNDSDGKIDFPADPDCVSISDTSEALFRQCQDGKDNDRDGKVDFPNDSGCISLYDDDEISPEIPPECSDGKDNDNDGKADYPYDTGCISQADGSEISLEYVSECADGVDNDLDKKVDFPKDEGCSSETDVSESSLKEEVKKQKFFGIIRETKNSVKNFFTHPPSFLTRPRSFLRSTQTGKIAERFIGPTLLLLSATIFLVSFHFGKIGALLKIIFKELMGLFLFVRKKQLGFVFDSLSKHPIEFAEVIAYDEATRMVAAKTYTGKKGEFHISLPAGKYFLSIQKKGYHFPPSSHDQNEFHYGHVFEFHEKKNYVSFLIPIERSVKGIDSSDLIKKFKKNNFKTSILSSIVCISFLLVFVRADVVSWVVFIFSLTFYTLFRRFFYEKRPEAWGRIYNTENGKPISNAVVMLFDTKRNVSVDGSITDKKGRYGFHANKERFDFIVEKKGYESVRVAGFANNNIAMRRKFS